MKWLSLLFLVLLSCQNPYVAPPPNTGGVVIAVGANGSIARSRQTEGRRGRHPCQTLIFPQAR